MLRPSKHSHPDRTVVAAATVILREVKKKRVATFDDLRNVVDKKTGGNADYLLVPAVSLLHLLGVVDYRATIDSFEYCGSR
jgi:hypothetical protein